MARTKASQMARKFANVEDSAESSEQDLDMVEGEEEVDKEQETAEGETGNKRKINNRRKEDEGSSGQDTDMVEGGGEDEDMGVGDSVNKRYKKKSKKEKNSRKGRGKGPREAPSHEELLDRLARKREADRLGAQRRKQEKQEEWDGMMALIEDLQAQLRTAKCLTPAIDQYYSRHGVEGLETEQAKLAVLKWVGRDKSKTKVDKTKVDKTKVDKTNVDKTKVDKTKVDKTKVDKTKVDKTKVDKTKVDKTKVDKTNVEKSKVMVERSNKLPVPRDVLKPSNSQSLLPLTSQPLSSLPLSTLSSNPHFRTSTPVRKSSLISHFTTPNTSRLLNSSSKMPVASSFKPLHSITSKSLLSSGDDSHQISLPSSPPDIQGSALNTTTESTAFSGDGSSMEF